MGAHEIDKNWTLVRRRDLNRKNKIMYIWSFKRNRAPDGSLVEQKSFLCSNGDMQQCWLGYWVTYSPVVNWVSVRAIVTLSILR